MIKVKATFEGLEGKVTASGYVIDKVVNFVALPSEKALKRFVRILNPLTGKQAFAQVLDVGPWNLNDDSYVFQWDTRGSDRVIPRNVRPQAESGKDMSGRETNKSGIDLGFAVWQELDMKDNTEVEWEFLI
jgi:hypothetical protein